MFYWSKDIGVYEGNRQPGSVELVGMPPSPYHTPQILDGQHIGWGIDDDSFAKLQAEMQASLESAVQKHMDAKAASYGYGDDHLPPLLSAISYADEPAIPKFQQEGQRFRAWRSMVWAACYAILADVLEGRRQVPTEAELLAELPTLAL